MPDAARRTTRLEAGLCATCGQSPHEPSRTRCAGCSQAARDAETLRREQAAARGLCEACMRAQREPGRGNRCTACADKYLPSYLARSARNRKATRS